MGSIVLIGEAPGEAEARTGLPFMGKAGQHLTEQLQLLSMEHMCYITNICKCRPPKNRTPTPAERETCTSLYLAWELDVLQAKVLVALGNTARDFLWRDESKPWIRGKPISTETEAGVQWKLFTYHPSYCVNYTFPKGDETESWATRELRTHLESAKRLALAYTI